MQVEFGRLPCSLPCKHLSAPASNCPELCTAEGSLSVLGELVLAKVRLAKVCEFITPAAITIHPSPRVPVINKIYTINAYLSHESATTYRHDTFKQTLTTSNFFGFLFLRF